MEGCGSGATATKMLTMSSGILLSSTPMYAQTEEQPFEAWRQDWIMALLNLHSRGPLKAVQPEEGVMCCTPNQLYLRLGPQSHLELCTHGEYCVICPVSTLPTFIIIPRYGFQLTIHWVFDALGILSKSFFNDQKTPCIFGIV